MELVWSCRLQTLGSHHSYKSGSLELPWTQEAMIISLCADFLALEHCAPSRLQSMVKPRVRRKELQVTMDVAPAQAVMGGFVALRAFPSPPPSALWSCKGQSS